MSYGNSSKLLVRFLQDNIGKTFTNAELLNGIGLDESRSRAINQKLNKLVKQSLVECPQRGVYRAKPELLKTNDTKKEQMQKTMLSSHIDNQSVLTPKAWVSMEKLERVKEAQPMDLTQLMNQVISIDEQNKMYRNALEQIVLLLEQAGIIEKA